MIAAPASVCKSLAALRTTLSELRSSWEMTAISSERESRKDNSNGTMIAGTRVSRNSASGAEWTTDETSSSEPRSDIFASQ